MIWKLLRKIIIKLKLIIKLRRKIIKNTKKLSQFLSNKIKTFTIEKSFSHFFIYMFTSYYQIKIKLYIIVSVNIPSFLIFI